MNVDFCPLVVYWFPFDKRAMDIWHKTPWMVRIFALFVVLAAVVLVVVKIVEATRAKANEPVPPMAQMHPQVSVSYIYEFVDSLLRAAQETARNSQEAQKAGHKLEASAFALAALAYL